MGEPVGPLWADQWVETMAVKVGEIPAVLLEVVRCRGRRRLIRENPTEAEAESRRVGALRPYPRLGQMAANFRVRREAHTTAAPLPRPVD